MKASHDLALLQPGRIGNLEIRNRFVRSATGESLADGHGFITQGFQDLHVTLARHGVGLLITGHIYVHPRGMHKPGMTGLDRDDHIGPLQRLTEAVHAEGARIFAELSHTGEKNAMPGAEPIAPSAKQNPQTKKTAKAATEEEILEVIDSFRSAARRAKEAGFDGIHIHGAHGYLISQFLSPFVNHREDAWGGPLENRQRFVFEVYQAIRAAAGADFLVTIKLGIRDFVTGGFTPEEGLATAERLAEMGVDAIEISSGVNETGWAGAWPYAGVTRKRALEDKLFHRIFAKPVPEGHFLEETRRVRERVKCQVIAVGGLRTVEMMESIIKGGTADFVSLSRPFIREPDLVRKIEQGKRGSVDCTSCNICSDHSGLHGLQCWRKTNKDLLAHAWYRFTGQLH